MSDTSKALEALDRIFNYCEEIDLHIPEEEQTGYRMNDDVAIIREALFENQKTGHWIEGQRNNLEIHNILCSNCLEGYSSKGHANSQYTREKFKFCPNCGAMMEGDKE